MARRLISGKPLFKGDNEHIHHMLLERGWSQRRVAFFLYGVCASFALIAMLFASSGSRATGFMLFVIGVVVIIAVGHLRYHEVDELKAGVKRTVADRRVRVANNIHLRRASRALSKATDLQELFAAVSQMLEFGAFAYSTVSLGRARDGDVNERALLTIQRRVLLQDAELHSGRIFWSWKRGDVEADQVVGSEIFWCLRLPLATGKAEWGWMNLYRRFDSEPLLVDINYLSGLFRKELSLATERILEGVAGDLTCEPSRLPMAASAGKITS
jgi:hypothetical protein